MSFEASMTVTLLVLAAGALVVFLVKGVALPFGPIVKATTQPLRFAAYCALYLMPILFQASLFYREHPVAQGSFLLLLCAFNIVGTLRSVVEPQRESSISRYEFATVRNGSNADRTLLGLWLVMGCFVLGYIGFRALSGAYPPLF